MLLEHFEWPRLAGHPRESLPPPLRNRMSRFGRTEYSNSIKLLFVVADTTTLITDARDIGLPWNGFATVENKWCALGRGVGNVGDVTERQEEPIACGR